MIFRDKADTIYGSRGIILVHSIITPGYKVPDIISLRVTRTRSYSSTVDISILAAKLKSKGGDSRRVIIS